MGKSIRITGVWLLVLAFYMPLMAQKNIAFADGVNKQKEIKLSEVASGVKYIPLETTAESLLGKDIMDVTFAGDYLFVCDYINLFQFTPEGKFVRKIGKAGEGPGEYTQSVMAVVYDEDTQQIFMSDFRKGKVLVYSFDGKYLYDIDTQRGSMTTYRDKAGNLFGVTNEYLYTRDKRGKELFVYNTKGKELYSFHFRPEQGVRYPGIIFTYGILYDHQGKTYYKNPLETTIFRLEGKKRIPEYKLDLSQYEKLSGEDDAVIVVDKKTNTGTNLPNKAADKKFNFFNILETNHGMGIEYAQENERRFAWYDKEKGALCRVRSPKAQWDGFTDDMEGGCTIFPRFISKNKMIAVASAAILLEKVKPAEAKGSLKGLLPDLMEDDNQVLVVAQLVN